MWLPSKIKGRAEVTWTSPWEFRGSAELWPMPWQAVTWWKLATISQVDVSWWQVLRVCILWLCRASTAIFGNPCEYESQGPAWSSGLTKFNNASIQCRKNSCSPEKTLYWSKVTVSDNNKNCSNTQVASQVISWSFLNFYKIEIKQLRQRFLLLCLCAIFRLQQEHTPISDGEWNCVSPFLHFSSPDLGVISIIIREFPTRSIRIHVPNQSMLSRRASVRPVKVTGITACR